MPFLKLQPIRAICIVQSLVLLISATPVHAGNHKKTITCDSPDFQRERCNIDNKGVQLKRQLSMSSCREGRDWGYDRRGIWVDNGCEAQFEVTQDSKGSDGDAAAALIIGGLLLGALALGAEDDKKQPSNQHAAATPPNWALGEFRGRNPSTYRDEDLKVERNGRIQVFRQGRSYSGTWLNGQRMSLQDEVFHIERSGRGLRLINASGLSSDYFSLD